MRNDGASYEGGWVLIDGTKASISDWKGLEGKPLRFLAVKDSTKDDEISNEERGCSA